MVFGFDTRKRFKLDPIADRVMEEIKSLGLGEYAEELDEKGYTVLPPDIACPDGLKDRLLDACLAVAENRNGKRPDLNADQAYSPRHADQFEGALGAASGDSPIGDMMQSLVIEGEVFEEALMNPVLLALSTYLTGYSSVLLTMACFIKGPNKTELPLHCDAMGPSPLSSISTECNLTYALTDYTREKGCLAVVPGSHKLCRQPRGEERLVAKNPSAIAVECPAGSLICWHGNTWHGAYNRRSGGLRVSLVIDFVRKHIRTAEHLTEYVPEDVLLRNSARFAVITHQAMAPTVPDQRKSEQNMARAKRVLSAYNQELGVDLQKFEWSPYA